MFGSERSKAVRRPQWSARLAVNPKRGDGNPPYVLIDRYGGIQRYVEPTPQVDLESHVGQTVSVKRDTGGTLLATQLDLPRRPVGAQADRRVTPAAFEELPKPELADGPVPPAQGEPIEGAANRRRSDRRRRANFDGHHGPMPPHDGVDPLFLDGEHEFESCPECGDEICQGRGCGNPCGFGSRPVAYVRGEYLVWWFEGMDTPPLVVVVGRSGFQSQRSSNLWGRGHP